MIIAFETDSSEVLENYLKEFVRPELMTPSLVNIITMWVYSFYFERKVFRVGRIVVFSQKGYIEQLAGYLLIFLTAGAFSAVFLHLSWLLYIDLFLMLPCMFFLSPKYHLFSKIRKLRWRGHKCKIGFVSNRYLINKLLFEVEHGSTGSL